MKLHRIRFRKLVDRKPIQKKTLIASFVLNAFQLLLAAGIVTFCIIRNKDLDREYPLFLAVFFIIAVSFFVSFRDACSLNKYDKNQGSLEDSMKKLENLNHTLRAQRHDFLNHLQVVYGLMEMKEYQDAMDYIDKVYNDIQKVSQALKTASPAINALLQAKLLYCENRGISLKINVSSRMEDLPMPAWEFCRILGNLIDNSIYALRDMSQIKWIEVGLREDDSFFRFYVKNNGPKITDNIRERIFEPGFTTKGEDGEGMGLSIVKGIIVHYQGGIVLESDQQKTLFECSIPKKE